jgi:type VI secretion system protein ImpH
LVAILVEYFAAPVSLEPFHAQWMPLPQEQRSRLGGEGNSRLRRNAVIGKRVWDAQHHFLLRIGPLSFAQYQDFLPGRNGANRLHDWVSLYTAREFEWGARLLLKQAEVPALQPGRGRQLGWSTWLGRRPRSEAVEGLLLKRAHAAASPVATA